MAHRAAFCHHCAQRALILSDGGDYWVCWQCGREPWHGGQSVPHTATQWVCQFVMAFAASIAVFAGVCAFVAATSTF